MFSARRNPITLVVSFNILQQLACKLPNAFHFLIIFLFLGCGQNYHKRCAYKIPNDCSLVRKRKCSSNLTNDLLSIQDAISPVSCMLKLFLLKYHTPFSLKVVSLVPQSKNQYSGRPIWIDTLPKIKVPHTFEVCIFVIVYIHDFG